ncbi:hypothetical protein FKM82_026779 [Ascaphus truei]
MVQREMCVHILLPPFCGRQHSLVRALCQCTRCPLSPILGQVFGRMARCGVRYAVYGLYVLSRCPCRAAARSWRLVLPAGCSWLFP